MLQTTVIGEDALLALKSNTESILEKTLFWSPPVPDWTPLKKSKNSSLRFACIAEDRLTLGLDFEGEMLILTPYNWKQVLSYSKPDFLLIESIWISSTGHWHMGQNTASSEYAELVAIVELAREKSIPTVFWNTRGHEYHEHYKEYAKHFDCVFCADPLETEKCVIDGINAETLLPCVQPAIFNPFRTHENGNSFVLNVLFDGWADIDKEANKFSVLSKLKPFGLNIVESRYSLFRNRLDGLPDYKDSILGCITQQTRATILKYTKAYASFDKTLSTKTTQQWMSLEAGACRLPVVHLGEIAGDDVRKEFVVECLSESDFLVEFVRYREDELYQERVAHLGWRLINQKHTFAHRVRSICAKAGVSHDWEEYPKASLISPTFRKELMPRCLKTYNQIKYPNKELVIVFNGNELPGYKEAGLKKPQPDIVITHVPSDMFAGAALNAGHMQATGKYCFRIDDDDHYGENYILDMVLQAKAVDAELFGKPPVPMIFEGNKKIYAKNDSLSFTIASQAALSSGSVWLGGNSIAGTKEFFKSNNYPDLSYGAADTGLVAGISGQASRTFAFMDRFNLVAERRSDVHSHTWRTNQDKLKAGRKAYRNMNEIMI